MFLHNSKSPFDFVVSVCSLDIVSFHYMTDSISSSGTKGDGMKFRNRICECGRKAVIKFSKSKNNPQTSYCCPTDSCSQDRRSNLSEMDSNPIAELREIHNNYIFVKILVVGTIVWLLGYYLCFFCWW